MYGYYLGRYVYRPLRRALIAVAILLSERFRVRFDRVSKGWRVGLHTGLLLVTHVLTLLLARAIA